MEYGDCPGVECPSALPVKAELHGDIKGICECSSVFMIRRFLLFFLNAGSISTWIDLLATVKQHLDWGKINKTWSQSGLE